MKMPIYKPVTVTGGWSILATMNGMSFPRGSRLIVQPEQHGMGSGPPREEQGTIYQKEGMEGKQKP